ncbi:MAG: sodium/proline symporter [Rhabdochlamydiaceae bacterium]|jgi:sodium/proline symporter
MYTLELLAIIVYFLLLLTVGYFSYKKSLSAEDFIIGSRSMNYWLTALSAHASDMSSWLFLAYPAAVFSQGLIAAWVAIGLISCMYLNWQFIAPKIRVATEQYNSLTFSSFFESRLGDTSGLIRFFTAGILIVFYTIYISAFLTGMGDLLTSLFHINYGVSILIGILIVIPYVFSGGYVTLAWIDLFQGSFLLLVIIGVPLYLLGGVGGFLGISESMTTHHLAKSLVPNFSHTTLISIISMTLGWGLGYFGQPHIVTKFMGIRNVSEIPKSKWIGMSWMTLSLGAATLIGLVGIPFFKDVLSNPEEIFILMVKDSFPAFIVGFILCAVLGATINAMSSQVLVLTSSLTEDFYKRMFRPHATSKELLMVSRLGVILVGTIAFFIALPRTHSIYILVEYAWCGIGASFGPLVILSLYSDRVNKFGAWAGILGGGIIAATWPIVNKLFPYVISPMLPAFFAGIVLILVVSELTKEKHKPRMR